MFCLNLDRASQSGFQRSKRIPTASRSIVLVAVFTLHLRCALLSIFLWDCVLEPRLKDGSDKTRRGKRGDRVPFRPSVRPTVLLPAANPRARRPTQARIVVAGNGDTPFACWWICIPLQEGGTTCDAVHDFICASKSIG